MSSDSLALFRKGLGPDLSALAAQHIQHDLTESDREALQSAASTVTLHTTIGTAIGIGLTVLLGHRIRSGRQRLFRACKTADKPQPVRFADGRDEAPPDLPPLLRPSRLGDGATYTLLGAGGLFVGGETGRMTGSLQARRQIHRDTASRERIRSAFVRFQAGAWRARADALERSVPTRGGDASVWS